MSIPDILKILLLFGVGYLVYKFVFLTLFRFRQYTKQGVKAEYFPLIGSFMVKQQTNFKKHNDALYDLKQLAVNEPNLKALVRNFGATPVVILLDPALKKDFAHQHHLYEVADYFGDFAKIFVSGLVGAKGDDWKKQRKIISQSFHFEFLKENVPVILNTTRQKLKELSQKSSLDNVLILDEMEKITSETVGKIFFSENLSNYNVNGKPVGAYLADTLENVAKSFISVGYLLLGPKYIEKGLWASHRKVIAEIKQLEDTCRKILTDRKNAKVQSKDLAWYLLETQKNPNEEDRISDDVIIANYVTFIMAGTGTTAFTLSMTLYALAQNPKALEKLRAEIKEIYDPMQDNINIEKLNKMDWCTAILKETLRVYNPAAFGPAFRVATKDNKLGDLEIKKDTIVGAAHIYSFFHSKYFDDPFTYKPERWIEKPNVSEVFAYTPFWAGPRNCIGQHLAMIEAKIMLCEFVKTFDFELISNHVLKMNSMKGYGPDDKMPMNISRKTDL